MYVGVSESVCLCRPRATHACNAHKMLHMKQVRLKFPLLHVLGLLPIMWSTQNFCLATQYLMTQVDVWDPLYPTSLPSQEYHSVKNVLSTTCYLFKTLYPVYTSSLQFQQQFEV